jgi:uncharacterized BrkB/YihY/UPF0761 family membrane protein
MKRTSVIIFLAGVIITIYCIIYFRPVLDVVDSDTMTVNPSGDKVAPWPLFVGLYTAFVGAVFYYVSHSSRKPDPTDY